MPWRLGEFVPCADMPQSWYVLLLLLLLLSNAMPATPCAAMWKNAAAGMMQSLISISFPFVFCPQQMRVPPQQSISLPFDSQDAPTSMPGRETGLAGLKCINFASCARDAFLDCQPYTRLRATGYLTSRVMGRGDRNPQCVCVYLSQLSQVGVE